MYLAETVRAQNRFSRQCGQVNLLGVHRMDCGPHIVISTALPHVAHANQEAWDVLDAS